MALPESITTSKDPTMGVSMRSTEQSQWITYIEESFATLNRNGTWSRVTPQPHARSLSSGDILRLKRDSSGRPTRLKERLVAIGNFHSDFEDYSELYAPFACLELFRTLMSVSVSQG